MSYLQFIKKSYCFDDVLLLPRESNIKSRKSICLETNLSSNTKKRNLILKTPIISSPMDTVTDSNMCIAMALNGGLGIMHRFMSESEQIEQVKHVKRYVQYIFTNVYKININSNILDLKNKLEMSKVKTLCVVNDNCEFCGLITARDQVNINNFDKFASIANLLNRIENIKYISIKNDSEIKINLESYLLKARDVMYKFKVQKVPILFEETNKLYGIITMRSIKYYFENKNIATLDKLGRLCCGAAIGINDINLDHIKKLINAGVDLLCIDVANGHNINCIQAAIKIRELYPNIIIMAGNICTADILDKYIAADIDCVRIGIGNGSICTTRLQTGIGYGQFSAVNEIMDKKIALQANIKLIVDGGSLGKIGNRVKSFASGGDAVMMGRTLAGCKEAPGIVTNRNGKRVKYYRGMASTMASISKNNDNMQKVSKTAEGIDGFVEVKGSVSDIIDENIGGIKSGFSYLGCSSLYKVNELRYNNCIKWALSTSIGLSETGTRVKN